MNKRIGKTTVALLLATAMLGAGGDYQKNAKANVDSTIGIVGEIILPGAQVSGVLQGKAVVGEPAHAEFAPYEMQVAVTVSGGVITGIEYSGVDEENASYAQAAYEGVCGQVIGKESETVEVDVISSATYSSKAFVEAINTACKEQELKIPKIKSVEVTKKGLKVSWKKTKDAKEYIVYRNQKKLKKVSKNYYLDKTAKKNGKKYTYTVVGVAEDRTSEPSNKVSAWYLEQPSINILLNASAGKMTLTWTKNEKATGYQIQYATNKNFKKAKIKHINNYQDIINTISGVNRGTTYYLRVRSYKKGNGNKSYSCWSGTKKITIYQ